MNGHEPTPNPSQEGNIHRRIYSNRTGRGFFEELQEFLEELHELGITRNILAYTKFLWFSQILAYTQFL